MVRPLISGATGVLLGAFYASLALGSVAASPFRLAPRLMAWRFIGRLLAMAVILAGLVAVGASRAPLAVGVLAGFTFRAAWLVRCILR